MPRRPMRASPAWLALSASLAACGSDPGPAFERSCRGERYLECDPHEYTVAREASLTPASIRPNDPSATAEVRVVVDRCPMHPSPAEVQLLALLPRGDGGSDVRVFDLGIALRDDGTNGDVVADDGVIEGRLTNPFGREVPGDRTILLRFAPVLAGCAGDALEVEYTTGPMFDPTP